MERSLRAASVRPGGCPDLPRICCCLLTSGLVRWSCGESRLIGSTWPPLRSADFVHATLAVLPQLAGYVIAAFGGDEQDPCPKRRTQEHSKQDERVRAGH